MDKKKTKNKNHNKKKYTASNQLAKFRGWIQAGATLLTNIHLPNFFKGEIYQGKGKAVCVPGLNCYSCPAASGACPIGSFQAVVGSSKYKFFLLYNRISHFVGSSARTLCLRIFVSVWLVTGFVAQSPDQKVFNKKTQATDIYQICSTAVGSCFITGAHSK